MKLLTTFFTLTQMYNLAGATTRYTDQCSILNPVTQICCHGAAHSIAAGTACCGRRPYKPSLETCCSEYAETVARFPLECCGNGFFNPETQLCCKGWPASIGTPFAPYRCCGVYSYNPDTYQCCMGKPQPIGPRGAELECCGKMVFNPDSHRCCRGVSLVPRFIAAACDDDDADKDYHYRSGYDNRDYPGNVDDRDRGDYERLSNRDYDGDYERLSDKHNDRDTGDYDRLRDRDYERVQDPWYY